MTTEPDRRNAGPLGAIARVVLAALVFIAVCIVLDLMGQRPINVLTAERIGGVAAVAIAVTLDALRRQKSNK